jgi:hypothetical protein
MVEARPVRLRYTLPAVADLDVHNTAEPGEIFRRPCYAASMIRSTIAVLAAATLLMSGATDIIAQPKPSSAKPTATRQPAKPAPQPAPAAAPVVSGEPGRLSDYWTIEQALPRRRAERPEPAAASQQFGRVPLQNSSGSVGLSSGQIRSLQFHDGRPVPGLDQYTQQDTSYVGMSLSVPSSSNSFLIPLPQPPGGAGGW